MFSVSRKSIKRFGITAGAAALFLSLIPGQAFAINQVPCDRDDFVHVWWHAGLVTSAESCFANGGIMDIAGGGAVWVDKVSSGNNDVLFPDENGDWVHVPDYTIVTYPNHPFHTRQIHINPVPIWG
ncbi:hypothetical protein NE235_02345 [Actinoallomurus spadix]|uniref:Streptomyces killer toxin-like beta/gamma crystallin domain-containing protein n=1 Tax=Actinoallomurus spadix TaxID=79912 RepID=A0ABN0XK10_9ACTN|nr:beta/gamma crystallin domain-containing protein [Actinoallomurus spadix]MCO5984942.1 hypothetical protein [Actinoallomurus spadix]